METFFTLSAELVESYSTKVLMYQALKQTWIAVLTNTHTRRHTHTQVE